MDKVAFIYSGLAGDLKSLPNNCQGVKKVLEANGWKVNSDNFLLQSENQLADDFANYQKEAIDNILIYYTGHGTMIEGNTYGLRLPTVSLDINAFMRQIYVVLDETYHKSRITLVLDACYSQKAIDTIKLKTNLEILCSSSGIQSSFECDREKKYLPDKMSHFTSSFCEAINTLSVEKITPTHLRDAINNNLELIYNKYDLEVQQKCFLAGNTSDGGMIIANKLLFNKQQELKQETKIFIDYMNLNNISKDGLLIICEDIIEKDLLEIIRKYSTLDDMISHLFINDRFPCIVKKFYEKYNQNIENWLESQDTQQCKELTQEEKNARVLIIFNSKRDGRKYDVSFVSKDVLTIPNGQNNEVYDLADETSKNELIKRMISYAVGNPEVDLILPIELMKESMNLWEIEFCESLSRYSKLNFRYIERYNSEGELKKLYEEQWKEVLKKINAKGSLYSIANEDDVKSITNNMNECGLSSHMLLEDKHFKYLFKTNMSFIMLWLTDKSDDLLDDLISDGIYDVQKNYYAKCGNSPINLMWDNPITNYYP